MEASVSEYQTASCGVSPIWSTMAVLISQQDWLSGSWTVQEPYDLAHQHSLGDVRYKLYELVGTVPERSRQRLDESKMNPRIIVSGGMRASTPPCYPFRGTCNYVMCYPMERTSALRPNLTLRRSAGFVSASPSPLAALCHT